MTTLNISKPYIDHDTARKRSPDWLVTVLAQTDDGVKVATRHRYTSQEDAQVGRDELVRQTKAQTRKVVK